MLFKGWYKRLCLYIIFISEGHFWQLRWYKLPVFWFSMYILRMTSCFPFRVTTIGFSRLFVIDTRVININDVIITRYVIISILYLNWTHHKVVCIWDYQSVLKINLYKLSLRLLKSRVSKMDYNFNKYPIFCSLI